MTGIITKITQEKDYQSVEIDKVGGFFNKLFALNEGDCIDFKINEQHFFTHVLTLKQPYHEEFQKED